MSVQFVNDGATIKVVDTNYTRSVQKDVTKFNVVGNVISMRSGKFGDQWNFSDVTSPSQPDIESLRALLESWLESENSSGVTLSGGLLDGAGRQEVSLPIVLGDYKFRHDLLPLLMDTEVGGGGQVTHNSATNSARLTVPANSGDFAIIQSIQRHHYFSGKAQQPEFTHINMHPQTGVTKRIGYFTSSFVSPFSASLDGMFLETDDTQVYLKIYRDGTEVLSSAQSSWSDPMDGTGASGINIDWQNFQVSLFDFLYLGGTGQRYFMIVGAGGKTLANIYNHSNTTPNTIVKDPSLPIRAEIRSTGGAGTLDFICAQVSSMGDSNQLTGIPTTHDTNQGQVSLSTSGTMYGLLSVRLQSGREDIVVQQESVSVASSGSATHAFTWKLHINPTLDNGSWSYSSVANTSVELARFTPGAGEQTIDPNNPGHIIAGDVGVSRATVLGLATALRKIGAKIDGTRENIVLSYTPHSANHSVSGAMTTVELL